MSKRRVTATSPGPAVVSSVGSVFSASLSLPERVAGLISVSGPGERGRLHGIAPVLTLEASGLGDTARASVVSALRELSSLCLSAVDELGEGVGDD